MSEASVLRDLIEHWRRYFALCKLKVVALIVFTAMIGMFLASPPSVIPWWALVFATAGIGLAAMSAAARPKTCRSWR